MPYQIDTSTIDFNLGNTGFTADYVPVDPSTEPPACTLPLLTDADLSIPDTTLTTLTPGCKFNFETVFPIPPIFIPKINIPPVPCPEGNTITSSVLFKGSGAVSTSGGITVVGDGCNFNIGGGVDIFVPPIPCPEGTTFTGQATITTSGIAVGGGSIDIIGGPCNFVLAGNLDIFVPPFNPGAGGGVSPGTTQNCPTTVADLFNVNSITGATTLDMPIPCFNCDPTSSDSPFLITSIPSITSLSLSTISTCTCCTSTGSIVAHMCEGFINMVAPGGNTCDVDPSVLNASAPNAYFQEYNICLSGSAMKAMIMSSDPYT